MRNLLLFSALLFLVHTSFAQQTLKQNFSAKGNSGINVGIKNNKFSVQSWKEAKISIVVDIHVNYPKAVIDQLVKIERYKISATVSGNNLNLQAPSLSKSVSVGGKALSENINITVKTPLSYTNNVSGSTINKGKDMKSIQEPVDVVINFVYPTPSASSTAPSGDRMGAAKSKTSGKEPTGHKDVQGKYGDIIIGSMPLNDFYD